MGKWRVGGHYPIHVYEDDRPVATFQTALDARVAVTAVNSMIDKMRADIEGKAVETRLRELSEQRDAETPLILHDEHFPECAAERDGLLARVAELTEQLRVSERSYQQALDRQHFWNQSADDLAAALQRVREHCDCIHGHGADSAAAEIERLRGIIGGIRVVAALGGITPERAETSYGGQLSPMPDPYKPRPATCEHGATMRHQFRMYGISDDWSDCPGPGPGLPEEGKQ